MNLSHKIKLYIILKMISVLKESQSMSNAALESFIIDLTCREELVNFYELAKHKNIKSIGEDSLEILKLFAEGTYQTYQNGYSKKKKLKEKQIFNLRKLSVLSYFEGKKKANMMQLCRKIDIKNPEVYILLIKMHTQQLINISIDENDQNIKILSSIVRPRKFQEEEGMFMGVKSNMMSDDVEKERKRVQLLLRDSK